MTPCLLAAWISCRVTAVCRPTKCSSIKEAPGQPEPVRTVDALGNVHYDDNQVILKGPKGWANLNTKDTNVWEGDYQMVGRQGRGKADLMKQRGENRYTILDNGSFTSCLPGSDTWSVVGSEIIHDREEQVAEIWNARFKVGPVPIFIAPICSCRWVTNVALVS